MNTLDHNFIKITIYGLRGNVEVHASAVERSEGTTKFLVHASPFLRVKNVPFKEAVAKAAELALQLRKECIEKGFGTPTGYQVKAVNAKCQVQKTWDEVTFTEEVTEVA